MSKIGANLYDDVKAEVIEWYYETRAMLIKDMLADGRPPLTEKTTPREQFELLSYWRATNDPRYTGDEAAQAALTQLEAQFGPAPTEVM